MCELCSGVCDITPPGVYGTDNDLIRIEYQEGFIAALNAVMEAVDLLPAPYKVRGDFDTYSSYNEGRMDMKDAVLSAIDALRKD